MGRKSFVFGVAVLAAGLAVWAGQAVTKAPTPLAGAAGTEPLQPALQLAADSADSSPVVVELFTSQGCSSCPPADALLDELADQPGLLALSFHVDYWDYIGWKDPFASPAHTQRQRDYARALGLRYVYTPQIVVDGRRDVVGSRRGAVAEAIEKEARRPGGLEVRMVEDGGGKVTLSAGDAPPEGATVYLVMFDDDHDTDVARGENRGRSIHNANVVREFRKLGRWTGEAMEFPLDFAAAQRDGRGGCAVIVQAGTTGPVLGAAILDLDETS